MTSFDLDAFSLAGRRRRRLTRLTQLDDAFSTGMGEPDEFGFFDYAGDAAAGVLRGVGSALTGVYGAFDILDDAVGLDVLPAAGGPLFGRSETFAGELTQGITNFVLGFVPIAGWLGRGAHITRSIKLASGLQKGAVGLGRASARATVAGVLTDLAVIDGHEARLTNLLQQFPALENPVSDFLSADPEDSEAVARLKGALEGVALGNLVDAFGFSLRALRKGREVRQAGQGTEGVIEQATDVDTIKQRLREADEELLERDAAIRDQTDDVSPFEQTGPGRARGEVEGRKLDLVKEKREGDSHRMWYEADADGKATGRPLGDDLDTATRSLQQQLGLDQAVDTIRQGGETPADQFFGAPDLLTPRIQKSIQDQAFESIRLNRQADAAVNPRAVARDELRKAMMSRRDLNLARMSGDVAVFVRAIEQNLGPLVKRLGGGTRPNVDVLKKAIQDNADLMQMDLEGLKVRSTVDELGGEKAIDRMHSWRIAFETMTEDLVRVGADGLREIEQFGRVSESTQALYAGLQQRQVIAQRTYRGMSGSFGRGLQSLNMHFMNQREVENLIIAKGGRKKLEDHMQRTVTAYGKGGFDKTAAVMQMTRSTFGSRFWDMTEEFWINSLLSNPRTWVTNIFGNGLVAVHRPLEMALGRLLGGQSGVARGLAAEIEGTMRGVIESAKMADASVRGVDPGDVVSKTMETSTRGHAPQITPEKVGLDENSVLGRMFKYLGKTVRFPGGILQGTDVFFRQMAWRSTAYRDFMEDAVGRGLEGKEASAYASDLINKLIDGNQLYNMETLLKQGRREVRARPGVDPDDIVQVEQGARAWASAHWNTDESVLLRAVAERSREAGLERTFTAPLKRGDGALSTVGSLVQETIQWMPIARLAAPFIRTPVNLLKYGLDRSVNPIIGSARLYSANLFGRDTSALAQSHNKWLRQVLSNDPEQKADALGRLATATGMVTTFGVMAQNGVVTGAGPEDRVQRQLLESIGWMPYSLRVNDFGLPDAEGQHFISYSKMDPFATVVGLVADMINIGRWSHLDDSEEYERVAMSVHMSLAKNILEKSYLQGLNNFLLALTDPEERLPRLAQRTLGGFVPGGPAQMLSFIAGAGVVDDTMREARSFVDGMRNKVPYLSQDMPPIRNFLGEPVHRRRALGSGSDEPISSIADMFMPVAHSTVDDNLIGNEIAELNYSFRPPKKKFGGIDIRDFRNAEGQDAWDRWMELQGQVKIGGRDLRRALRELIRSDRYRVMPSESTFELQSPRVAEINRVVGQYRRYAKYQMLREYGDLQLAVAVQRDNQMQARAGLLQ